MCLVLKMGTSQLKYKVVFLFAASFFLMTSLKAAEGCLVGSTIYPTRANATITANLLSSGINAFTAISPVATNDCISGTTTGSCQVCHGTLTAGIGVGGLYLLLCTSGLGLGRIDTGVYYSNYILECDLDNYCFVLVLSVAALGVSKIAKISSK